MALSRDYGGIEAYAEGLLVLREDLRDPVLRARGAAWKACLSGALEDCFSDVANAPQGIGLLIAAQWQGSLLWWSFDPRGELDRFVEDSLKRFVSAVVTTEFPSPLVGEGGRAAAKRRGGRMRGAGRTPSMKK